MAILDYNGGQLSYSESGKGTAVVFLHGFLGSKDIWNDYSKQLSNKYRIVCIDLLGHGSSSCFGYAHSMTLMSECVMAILKHLNIRRFYLIGHSLGGYVSMALGEKHPDQIKGLIMFHSSVSDDPPDKKKERDKLITVVQKNKELVIRAAIPNLFNLKHKPYKRAIAKASKQAMATSVQGIIAALEGMKNRQNREIVLRFTPYPVLFIIGKHDNVLPEKKLLSEVAISENARYIILEKTGHMGFIEEPDASLIGIRSMLK